MTWPILRGSSNVGTAYSSKGFFSIDKRDDHWWFITPAGKPFFSIGLNHIDPASLRYPENIHLWRDKYQGSTIKWIKPHIMVIGSDWKNKKVIGQDFTNKLVFFDRIGNYSTTNILGRINE